MKKLVWTLLILLAACSNQKDQESKPAEENPINWYAGVGQFNGTLDFGNLVSAENKIVTINVKNVGDSTLTGPVVLVGNDFYLAYQNCTSLLAGKNCSVKLGFNAANKDNGVYSGTLQLGEQRAQISAAVNIVHEPAELEFLVNGLPIQNDTIDFGTLKYNQSILRSLSIKVRHDTAKNSINNVRLSTNNDSDFTINYDNCSNRVMKEGSSCTVKLSISGIGKSGEINDSLIYGDKTLALKAEVKNLATVAQEESDIKLLVSNQIVNPGPVNLGTWNLQQGQIINLYLKNEGSAAGIVEEVVLPPELQLSHSTCEVGKVLNSKKSCLLKIYTLPQNKGAVSSAVILQGNNYQLQSSVREPGDKIYCSVDNADQSFMTWNGSSYSGCIVESCLSTHHLVNNVCESNSISCSVDNGSGTQIWNGSSYDSCQVNDCSVNYHVSNNQCVANSQSCLIADGTGIQTWGGANWNTCQVENCNTNFHTENNLTCISNTRPCNINNGTGSQTWSNNAWGSCQLVGCSNGYAAYGNSCLVASTQWRVRHVAIVSGHTPRTANWEFSDPNGVLAYTVTGSQTMDNNAINNSANQPWGFSNNCSDQGGILGLSTPNSYTLSIQFSSPKHLSQVRAYSVYVGGSRSANLAVEYYNGTSWVNANTWTMSAPSGCGWMSTGSFGNNY